jgi:3',5'-cyclic AMP phosphodiesterase CpdA
MGKGTSSMYSFRPPFPKADVLLHSGDLTNVGTVEENRVALNLLASIPAELKLVIAGNHDLTLDKEYWKDGTAEMVRNAKNYDPNDADVVEQIW